MKRTRESAACARAGLALAGAMLLGAPSTPGAVADQPPARVTADARTVTQMIDQAAADLALLASDGTEAAVLLGIPTADERTRATLVAGRTLDLLERAERAATAAVARLEEGLMGRDADPARAADRAAAAEAELARLVDVEQAQRIPFLRGCCHALLAGAGDGENRAESARAAIKALSALRLGGGAEPARRTMLVAAILNSGSVVTGSGDDSGGWAGLTDAARDAIDAEMRALAAVGDAGLDGPSRQRLEMIRVVLAAADERNPPASDADALGSMAASRGLLIAARRAPARAPELLGRACAALLAPLHRGSSPPDDGLRLRTYARVSALIGPGTGGGGAMIGAGADASSLPAEAALARAVTLLREQPDSIEARALLAHAGARRDADSAIRATALWESAAAHLRRSGDEREAAAELEKIIALRPAAPEERVTGAARTLERLADRMARGSAPGSAERAEWERIQLSALDALLSRPAADGAAVADWRSRSLALRVRLVDPATATPAQLEALAAFDPAEDPAPASSGASGGAAPVAAAAVLADLYRAVIDHPRFEQRNAGERLALVQIMRRGMVPSFAPRLSMLAGEAELQLGRADRAALELRTVIGGSLDRPGDPARPRVRLALVAALRAMPGSGPAERLEALTLLRELTAPLDSVAGGVAGPRPEWYWRAWADTLELVAAAPGEDDNLRAQIRRLELLDPAMGGPATSARIAAVKRALPDPPR